MRASFRLQCLAAYHRGPQVCGSGRREAGGRQCQRRPCFRHLEIQDNNSHHDREDRRENLLLVKETGGLLATAVDRTFFKSFKISERLFLRIGFASNLTLSFSFICNVGIVTTGNHLARGKS